MDVISTTLVTFITHPIQLVVHALGISLFQGKSSLIYPYHLMTPEQIALILELCSSRSTYQITFEHIVMKHSSTPIFAPLNTTLRVLCKLVFDSKTHTDPKIQLAICNIIIQRIQGYVPISSAIQKDLNMWVQQTKAIKQDGGATKEWISVTSTNS